MYSLIPVFKNQALFKILGQLISQDQPLFLRELERVTGLDINQVQRETTRLSDAGLITFQKNGRNKTVSLNKNNTFLPALKTLFEQDLAQQDIYVSLGSEDNMNFLTASYNIEAFEKKRIIDDKIVEKIPHTFYEIKNGTMYFWTNQRDFVEQGLWTRQSLLDGDLKLDHVPAVYQNLYKEVVATYANIKRRASFEKKEAKNIIHRFREIMNEIGLYAWPALFDLYRQPHTSYIQEYVDHHLTDQSLTTAEALEQLLAPPFLTVTQHMRARLLRLALDHSDKASADKALQDLHDDYRWLNFGWNGPEFTFEFFQTLLSELQAKPKNELKAELDALLSTEADTERRKERLFAALHIDPQHQSYIKTVAMLSWLKLFRKDLLFAINWMTFHVLDGFAAAQGLSREEIAYLTLDEVPAFIDGSLKNLRETLRERRQHGLLDPHSDYTDVYAGQAVSNFLKTVRFAKEESVGQITLLNGTMACLGPTGDWVYGVVKIVERPADMAKLNPGDILVSHQTTPDILPAMKKAGAIVTDQGGITCHAAIVGRELNKVCLIGTKYATKIFKDGDKVVVCPRHSYIKFQ